MVQAELQVSLVQCHLLPIRVELAGTDFSSPVLPTQTFLLALCSADFKDQSSESPRGCLQIRVPGGRMTLKKKKRGNHTSKTKLGLDTVFNFKQVCELRHSEPQFLHLWKLEIYIKYLSWHMIVSGLSDTLIPAVYG